MRNDLSCDDLEIIILQVDPLKQKPFLVCIWYRPPNSSLEVFDKLEKLLQDIELTGLEVLLMGDLNCDIMNSHPSCNTNRLSTLLENYHLKQLISKPTRITRNSSSTIDLIITSSEEKVSFNDVVQIGLSDHYMIVASWGNIRTRVNEHKYITFRDVKKMNVDNFEGELLNESWNDVHNINDVDECNCTFASTFKRIFDKHAPSMKTKRVKQSNVPWITQEIKDMMKERDKQKRKAKRFVTARNRRYIKYLLDGWDGLAMMMNGKL